MRKNSALERLRFEHKILNAETVNPHEKTTLNKRVFKGVAKGVLTRVGVISYMSYLYQLLT